jgi:hypothetical protein
MNVGKLFKLGMLVVSSVVLIFIIVGVINGVSIMGNGVSNSHQSASSLPGKAEYDKIRVGDAKTGKGGMTIAEVEKILGQPTTQTEGKSGNLEIKGYTFATNAGPNSIMVTFINGYASGKTQTGLK